ncbi:WXG100 family type VII secretion target [Micromonospora krabiensis]|uniref:WXG100 family type VII secretion target n=1 Tax=Micromonospora krabiensis TaxID=307121 RepID=A0A1C3MXM0_9ACTN|nr:WXG100 family type VII secretion target [Micromonospora krabiensis]SBV25065.1 WXG100 family type VII secretion target [Micromonospora krabiensis]
MPPASRLTTTTATRQQLVSAFNDADDQQREAYRAVAQLQADLAGQWHGVASNAFTVALDEWMQGLNRVTQALNSLRDNVVRFGQVTDNTETDNLQLAKSPAGQSRLP